MDAPGSRFLPFARGMRWGNSNAENTETPQNTDTPSVQASGGLAGALAGGGRVGETSPTERPSWHVEHASSAHPSPHTRVFTWHVLPRVPAGRDGDEDSRGNVIIARALITGVLAQGGRDSRRPGEGLHHAGNSEPRSYHHKCQFDYFNHIRSLLINMN